MAELAILIPVKQFGAAKERLRLGGVRDVTELARSLAENVILASAPRHVIVLTESDEVSEFAGRLGVEVFHSAAASLNEAVSLAYRALGPRFDSVAIVHGDLARPEGLGRFEPSSGVTIVTDRHQRGTNVLVLPSGLDFRFAYGIDSKDRHQHEALRLELSCQVIVDSPWALDIDEPDDIDLSLETIRGGPEAPSNARPRAD
jgi:2-phospho-L-lactate guanylyltransferase